MTVRVKTLKGPDAGRYYVEELPNYYLDGGEPSGQWFGRGAELLPLAGVVEPEAFLALMSGLHPASPHRPLGRAYDERSVRGFDITASAPKSVSILFALGDGSVRREVLAAHDAAVTAMADWIERHAHTRFRLGGSEPMVFDAEGIVAAAFRQHTSRALDPQLHTHLVLANRVKSPDGRWLALDARTIKRDQRTLSAIYHAGLRSELSMRLGVRWATPEHGIAEIKDVPAELCELFSKRTNEVLRASTRSSTGSSAAWVASRHHASDGSSSARRSPTAARPNRITSTPHSCTLDGPRKRDTSGSTASNSAGPLSADPSSAVTSRTTRRRCSTPSSARSANSSPRAARPS